MKNNDYKIEGLSGIFADHAIKAEENDKLLLQQFLEQNPGSPIPDHFIDPFNIAKALSIMAFEINRLKNG